LGISRRISVFGKETVVLSTSNEIVTIKKMMSRNAMSAIEAVGIPVFWTDRFFNLIAGFLSLERS
jgi:hypothetical protein